MKFNFINRIIPKAEMIPEETKRSTALGIGAALLILVLFILSATYLRSFAFGIILAYFLLPLEQFYEKKIFSSPFFDRMDSLIASLRRKKVTSPEEIEKEKMNKKTLRATLGAFFTLLIVFSAAVIFLGSIVIPFAIRTGKNIGDSSFVQKMDKIIPAEEMKLSMNSSGEEIKFPPKNMAELMRYLKPRIVKVLEEHQNEIAVFAFSKGKNLFAMIFSMVSSLGSLLVDILLSLFFFVYILQKLAACRRSGLTTGEWAVNTIYSSPWMPHAGEEVRREAAGIINHLGDMFSSWIRGYLTIIFIEWPLYMTLFSLFRVPYALGLGFLAGMTVLIPCVGLASSILLTCSVTIAFCDGHIAFTFCGIALTYILVNGILEQLILYPSIIGGAIGLTLLETILVVLIGAAIAGIPGMILSVPAAAVLKYLVPKIYNMRFSSSGENEQKNSA